MTTIEQLVTSLRDGSLKLPALFDALSERGSVPDEQYQREVAWLERLRDVEQFSPQIVRALLTKLANMQVVVAPEASAPDEDVTHVFTSTPRTGSGTTTGTGEREPGIPRPSDGEDGTVVRPRTPAELGNDAATVVQPPSHPAQTQSTGTGTGTGTGSTFSSGSVNTTAWQRMADAETGEYATVGMLLKGRFLLERELGRGGMGVVYLARDERKVEARDRDPYVAVKVLNDEFRKHPDSLIALQRESRRSQQLAHDNIVRVYDFDKDRTIVFMTMEYIDGKSLKALIREEAYDGWPLAKARPLIEGMGWALKRAHSAGVVHSDFKPGNVMVTKDGVAKVFDFGIARAGKFVETSGEQTVFDASTLGALTPAYASLEMLRGADPQPSDDVYAYGCVVYEMLTGKHPFDKLSAEVALKEGRKPPKVRGLTTRQNKTLADAVAFHNEHRLQSALQVIDGLRHVSWGERARPLLIYGAVAAVVLGGGGYGVSRYLGTRHVNEVVSRFSPSDPQHYGNEDQALAALAGLGDEESNVVTKHGDVIAAFLLGRLDTYWNPAQKRYNYVAVQHVFSIRDKLKLYSQQLDTRRYAIDQERNRLLNTLDTQLSDRTAAGALFPNQPDNVVDTLDQIRAIDPTSALLDNAELKLKYDIAIGQSLDAGKLGEAKQQLAVATRLFPKAPRLQQREAQLATLTSAAAAAARITAKEQSVPEARAALGKLLASPSLAPEWQAAVAGSLKVLHDDHAPATQQMLQQLPDAVAGQAAGASTPTQVQQAASMVAMALTYAPESKPLLVQRDRLAALQQQQQTQLAAESAAAEVASRIQSLKSAAAAHDVNKATESLARIRVLQPDNPFLKTDGPQLLAETYIGQSVALAERGKYRLAADTLDKGVRAVGQNKDLRAARARMDFVADLMQARSKAVSAGDIEQLRKRLASLDHTDASGVGALQKSLTARGALPDGSFAKLLDSLKPAVATTQPAPGSAPATIAPQTSSAAPPASAPMAAAVHPITPTPGAGAPPAATADPCARPGMAGHGRICADRIGSGYGPALVVVPGVGGGAPFAMSRTEITVGEFNKYCAATRQCAAKGSSASLPVADISLAAAKAYAAWLTQVTGYTYRLPTDAEWLHAAKAGQGWTQAPDSNCIPPAAGADGGVGAPIAARGRQPNPWGLVNMTGNLWEWVVSGGSVMVRGGSFNSYWSDCTVASKRSDSGSAQNNVGFRLLRQIK
jgi:non-specific serine/threonine protein kinase